MFKWRKTELDGQKGEVKKKCSASRSMSLSTNQKTEEAQIGIIFISYVHSRDRELVDHIATELSKAGFSPWVDSKSIPYGEEWWIEITDAIKKALTVVFLISQESIKSKYCNEELNLALSNGKRIIPILVRSTSNIPKQLDRLQYLEMLSDSELGSKLQDLIIALKTNYAWEKYHVGLLNKVHEYKSAPKDHQHQLLLSQYEMAEAQKWLQSVEKNEEYRILPVIRRFLAESRKHIERNDRFFQAYTKKISHDFKYGGRDWEEITKEILKLPLSQRTRVFTIVVLDAIRGGGGRMGDHFFYLLGNLPKALKMGKPHWARFIHSVLLDDYFRYSVIFSLLSDNSFPIKPFFTACEFAAETGQATAAVSYPIRVVENAISELRPDFILDNIDLIDSLYKFAHSRAQQLITTMQFDTELEKIQTDMLVKFFEIMVPYDYLEEREQAMDSVCVLFNEILKSFDVCNSYDTLSREFDSKKRLHFLGQLAVSLARNRHWGTAYKACHCLFVYPLFDISKNEMSRRGLNYYLEQERIIIDPRRRSYARRKCLEVINIMLENGARLLWPAVLAGQIYAMPKVRQILELLQSSERKSERDRYDDYARMFLEKAIRGEVDAF